jgi:hypothetical protein
VLADRIGARELEGERDDHQDHERPARALFTSVDIVKSIQAKKTPLARGVL